MGKNFTAIGNVSNSADIEKTMSPEGARDYLAAFAESHYSGDILSADEAGKIVVALASLGSDEMSVSEDGALQGNSVIEYTAEGAGIEVSVCSKIGVKGVLDRCRNQWSCDMGVTKTGGDATVYSLKFAFRFLGFGTSTAGETVVLFDYGYGREFKGSDQMLADFVKDKKASASQFDFSKFEHWGYFLMGTCDVATSEGTLEV